MSPVHDDDLLPGLPALDGGDDEGAPLVGLDDEDTDAAAEESVGLDTEVGTGEDTDDDLAPDEAESWTTDSEDAADLDDGEEDFGSEDSGWTDDATASVADLDDIDDDLEEPAGGSLVTDRGEEGVDEDPARGEAEDDLDGPPSDAVARDAKTEEEDSNDLGFFEEEPSSWSEEPPVQAGRAAFDREPAGALRVTHLGPSDDATACASCDTEVVLAGGTHGLYQSRHGSALVLSAEDGEGEGVTSVVRDRHDTSRIAIGTRLAGVRTSIDGGITFDAANGWKRHAGDVEVALFVAAESTTSATRLWARTRSGSLYRSDDFGASWSAPILLAGVRAFAVAGDGGGVAAVVASRGAVHIARSHDGGTGWSMRAAPLDPTRISAGGGDIAIAILGDVVVLAHPADPAGLHVSCDGGATWTSDASLRGACALALAREDDAVVVYVGVFQAGLDGGVLVRRTLAGVSTLILDVAAECRARALDLLGDPDGDLRIFAIETCADASTTCVFAATGAGLFRVDRARTGS